MFITEQWNSIPSYLCSLSFIQCDNKEEPLFLLLDIRHRVCFSLERQKASIRWNCPSTQRCTGLALELHQIRWAEVSKTPFMSRNTVGFLRAARFKPNDTFRWANKTVLSQEMLLRSRRHRKDQQMVVIVLLSERQPSQKEQNTSISASLRSGPESGA